MPTASRGDRRIRFETTGTVQGADRTPVLLVPGLGGGARIFGTLPRRFDRTGFPCVTFDPVGYGGSSPHTGEYDLDAAADDLIGVLDHLDLPACDLVGTSLGGKVALCAAHRAPDRVRRLVLLASAAVATPRGTRISRFFEVMASRLDGPELSEVLATFLFGNTFHNRNPELVEDIVRSMRWDPTTREVMIAQARAIHSFDGTVQARTLSCPTLCLAGAEDSLTGSDAIAATADLIPDASFEVVPGAGHTLLLESARVFDRIVAFLGDAPTSG